MAEIEKTPWRKNNDKRYISGEDLKTGVEMKKGLKPEMIVTLTSFNDAPAFDSKIQKEVDKTAIWMKEYPNGKMLYKPALLNVERGEFLSKEIGNGSLFIDDFSHEIPFVMYAKVDKRHGHVVAFKKYYPPSAVSDTNGLFVLSTSKTLVELAENWNKLTPQEKNLPTVLASKEKLKNELK